MQLFKNLLGGSKKENYFLELDETEENQSAESEPKSEPKTQPEKPTAKAKVDQPEKIDSEAAKPVESEPNAVKDQPSPPPKPEPKRQSSQSGSSLSGWDGPDWAKQLIENSQQQKQQENGDQASDTEVFADRSLLPDFTGYRRMPGPSLNKFMDMAKQVKKAR